MDPFLLTHNVRHQLYDIGPRLSPISIRDQMIRAHILVVRALRQQIIGPDKPLLIIGAGAAGATAAITAADHRVPTVLLERGEQRFSLQLGCNTRWIDPVVYDWPADHWSWGEFPWRGTKLKLAWQAGKAAVIAGVWEDKFGDEEENNPNLTVHHKAVLENPATLGADANRKLIEVYFNNVDGTDRRGPYEFAMIISCIGAGPDKVEIDNYRGTSFWKDDLYSKTDLGFPDNTSRNVLISGSGDGALQDFLRIVTTKESAKAIYEALPASVQTAVGPLISASEDQYQRAFIWSGNADGSYKRDDCIIQNTRHDQYIRAVVQILDAYRTELHSAIETILKPDVSVTLAFECGHFSHGYPLNHFLVLLLGRHLGIKTGRRVFYPYTRIVKIAGSDGKHVCNKSPDDCRYKSHEARLIFKLCGATAPFEEPVNLLPNGPFDLIVVRHGINWNAPLFGELPKANTRQMLPYYLGWDDTVRLHSE